MAKGIRYKKNYRTSVIFRINFSNILQLFAKNNNEYIKEDDSIRGLGKFTHDVNDEVFIERTNAAMDRVENDDEEWLSVDEFLKELETW